MFARHRTRQPRLDADDPLPVGFYDPPRGLRVGVIEILQFALRFHSQVPDIQEDPHTIRRALCDLDDVRRIIRPS